MSKNTCPVAADSLSAFAAAAEHSGIKPSVAATVMRRASEHVAGVVNRMEANERVSVNDTDYQTMLNQPQHPKLLAMQAAEAERQSQADAELWDQEGGESPSKYVRQAIRDSFTWGPEAMDRLEQEEVEKAIETPLPVPVDAAWHEAYRKENEQMREAIEAREREQLKEQFDVVARPAHYNQGSIECIDAIQAALTPEEFRGYCKGNAQKYLFRERHKGGGQDLQKARWYLNRLIDQPAG